MSEEQKENTPKAKLPIKTQIAVWWIIVIGVFLIILEGLVLLASFYNQSDAVKNDWLVLCLSPIGILTIFSGIFLFRKSQRAWKSTAAVLIIAMICVTAVYTLTLAADFKTIPPILFFYLVPLILIFIDRKNYFEMTEKQKGKAAKTTLSLKTEIAVWWICITAAIIATSILILSPIGLVIACLNIILGSLLLTKNKRAWISAIIIFYIVIISIIILLVLYSDARYFILVLLLVSLIPFILIILDRKNYFKMVRQRELTKNDVKPQPRLRL